MSLTRDSKVGAFVLAGMIVAGLVVFLIGDERRFFDAKDTFRVTFSDVQGLKAGAPLRMGGVDIGTVARVEHADDPADTRLYVTVHVVRSEAARVREDSAFRVVNKGLLGDKMLEVTSGSTARPPARPGTTIRGEDPADLGNLASQVGSMAQHADTILGNLENTSKTLADEKFRTDVQGTISSLHVTLDQVSQGDGYLHKLLTDKAEADRLSRTMANLERASEELAATMTETHRLVARVNAGPGFAHELVYGEGGNRSVAQIGEAAGEVAQTLRGVREGSGMARALLFGGGDERTQGMLANLDATTADVRHIVADVRAGKGTIGALLADPSVYEDMKSVLGNVQRNDALRALVRYSIKQDEKKGPPHVGP